jgi:hypothetical protein
MLQCLEVLPMFDVGLGRLIDEKGVSLVGNPISVQERELC